jgi:hypothetical protein
VNTAAPHPRQVGRLAPGTRLLTTWVLVCGFLLQPILGYLVTPLIAQDPQGQQIVICTLQGEKLVTLDIPQLVDHGESEHCSALTLYQMAGSTQVSAPPPLLQVTLYAIGSIDQTADHQHGRLHFSAYPTRAPPVV